MIIFEIPRWIYSHWDAFAVLGIAVMGLTLPLARAVFPKAP